MTGSGLNTAVVTDRSTDQDHDHHRRRPRDVVGAVGNVVRSPRRLLVLIAGAVAVWVVMNEISKVVGDVTVGDRAHAASSVFAPLVGVNGLLEAFGDWATYVTRSLPALQSWLFLYLGLDLLFIVLYLLIAIGVRQRSLSWWTTPDPTSSQSVTTRSPVPGWSVLWWGVFVIAGIDVVEDVFGILLIRQLPEGPGEFASPAIWSWILLIGMMLATWLKWLAVLVVLVTTVYQIFTLDSVTPRRWRTAVKIQRFSLVVVGLLAAFMVAPGGDIFDQVADVQRSWITLPSLLQAVVAVMVFAVLAAVLWYLGGLRATRSGLAFTGSVIRRGVTTSKFPNDDDAAGPTVNGGGPSWVVRWLAIPVGLILLAILLGSLTWAHVSWPAVVGACAVPVAVVGGNAIVLKSRRAPIRQRPRLIDPFVTPYVWLVGDLLAVAVGWLLGLSVVRSFTALALLDVDRTAALIAMAIGAVVAVGVWPACWGWIGRRFRRSWPEQGRLPADESVPATQQAEPEPERAAGPGPEPDLGRGPEPGFGIEVVPGTGTGGDASRPPRPWFDVSNPRLRLAAYVAFPVATIGLVLAPGLVGEFGPVATVAACLAVLAMGLIAVAVTVQWREPLRIFRAVGLDTTPALTLIAVAAVLIVTVFDRAPVTHLTRAPVTADGQQARSLTTWRSMTFEDSVQQWLDDPETGKCGIDLKIATGNGRAIHAMPMVLIGAAGGGVRAAWWTANALSVLAADPCGRHAVLAVSSVSGSSLGMALMLASDDPIADAAKLGDSAPLSQAVDGLLARDLFSGLTGITVAAPFHDGVDFPDRAALLEQAWEQAVPALATPFPNPPDPFPIPQTGTESSSAQVQPAWKVPWRAFFNTTSARTGCRVVISDVSTDAAGSAAETPDCDLRGGAIPGSYNLFAAQPCLAGMRISTAALLSSRFPYILPSGLVDGPGCGDDASDQLIDGGYAENSGLGTIGDLADQYMPLVRAHNSDQLAAAGTEPITVVVPIIISLDNSPQSPVTVATPNPPVAEALVPVMSGLRRGATLQNSAALLERTVNGTADWLPCTPPGECTGLPGEVQSAVAKGFATRGIQVAPASAPRIAAPLGWAMSAASRDAMQTALGEVLHDCRSNCDFSKLVDGLRQAGERGP